MGELSIREKQIKLLDMYKVINAICEKHGWTLFATGGTVLGAIRHRGFIPWDDDIDLALPREEFERFAIVAPDELPSNMKIRWMERGRHYTILCTDCEIELTREWAGLLEKNQKAYLYIDLQPLDGVANNYLSSLTNSFVVMYRRAKFKMADSDRLYKGKRSIFERCLIAMMMALKCLKKDDLEICTRQYDLAMQKHSYSDNRYIADYCGRYHFKDVYPKDWWGNGVFKEFEDCFVRVPSKYDKYLRRIYGEYMAIPKDKTPHSNGLTN